MRFAHNVFWIGGATFVSLLVQFLIAKLVAIYLPISDFGIIGQYLSLLNIVQFLGGGIISTAIVKYFSEFRISNKNTLSHFYRNSFSLIILLSSIFSLLLMFIASPLSKFLFDSDVYIYTIILLALSLLPYNCSKLILSMFSGLSKPVTYGGLSIFFSLILLVLSLGIFFFNRKLESILFAFPISYLFAFPIFLYFLRKLRREEKIAVFKFEMNIEYTKKILFFSFMPMITMLLGPLVQIMIRSFISFEDGWQVIGEWQAINKISDAYMVIISTFLLNYIVPLLSPLSSKKEMLGLFNKTFLKLFFLALLIFTLAFFLKKWIVLILYSEQYIHLVNLLDIQFIGDFFRVLGFYMVYTLIAKARVYLFLMVEIISTILLLFFTVVGYEYFNLYGMVLGYLFNAFIFFLLSLAMVIYFFKNMEKKSL